MKWGQGKLTILSPVFQVAASKKQNKKDSLKKTNRPSFKEFRKNMMKAKAAEAFCTILTPIKDKNTGKEPIKCSFSSVI